MRENTLVVNGRNGDNETAKDELRHVGTLRIVLLVFGGGGVIL